MSLTSQASDSSAIPWLYPVSISLKPQGGHQRCLSQTDAFMISAIAPAMAVIFTNPFDTIKVRQQLQNEGNNVKVYRNSYDAFTKIYRSEGIKGLQKGILPAILREGSKNMFRIGMYDPIMSLLHDPAKGSAPGWKRILAGSMCGLMGAFSCNPFELVKTRLQSASTKVIVGNHQFEYSGVWNALKSIIKEDGYKGLYRGSVLSMFRSIMGSGSNLATYSLMKEHLILSRGWSDSIYLDIICGLSSGVVSCIFMNPTDVTRTRYYNQKYVNGKGVTYSSGIDCARTILRKEGALAFYTGFTSHFLRIGPHFVLTFLFLGVLRRGLSDIYSQQDLKDSFKLFDKDADGVIDDDELSGLIKLILSKSPNDFGIDQKEHDKIINIYKSRIMSKADVNRDGVIDLNEYALVESELKSIYKERKTAGSNF